jgi:hypothetical protein
MRPRLRRHDHRQRPLLSGTKATLVGRPSHMTRLTRLHDRAVALAQQTVALIALGLAAPSAALAGFVSLAYAEAIALLAFAMALAELAIGLPSGSVIG